MATAISLRTADVRSVVSFSADVDHAMPHPMAMSDLLAALSRLIPCDMLFWTRFDVDTPLVLQEIGHPRSPWAAPTDEWIRHRPEHPICSGRHGPVVALSDVLSPRELRESWLYQECLKRVGWEHELGANLSHATGEINDIIISRTPGRDFDERDHLVLQLLHPHLDAAVRRLEYPAPRLTPRETDILALVREGLSNAQVARRLVISEATVRKHLENVYARTGARSRTQAVHLCDAVLP
jgi:DNA-binding CsgD family transcriptional regulator